LVGEEVEWVEDGAELVERLVVWVGEEVERVVR
jgi:hypothetical protein